MSWRNVEANSRVSIRTISSTRPSRSTLAAHLVPPISSPKTWFAGVTTWDGTGKKRGSRAGIDDGMATSCTMEVRTSFLNCRGREVGPRRNICRICASLGGLPGAWRRHVAIRRVPSRMLTNGRDDGSATVATSPLSLTPSVARWWRHSNLTRAPKDHEPNEEIDTRKVSCTFPARVVESNRPAAARFAHGPNDDAQAGRNRRALSL